MTSDAPAARHHDVVPALLIGLFMASGATSLVYETIWARHLHLVFGTGQLAVCALLAAFMGGLAAGGFLGARWGERVRRPLLAYAALEAVIGLYALAFPALASAVEPAYLWYWRTFEPGPGAFGLVQLLLLGGLLLPPAACMGATLPLLARFAAERDGRIGRAVGRLYGANTIGAVVGTALAGFVLLPGLGLSATTRVAAAVNLGLALGAAGLSRLQEARVARAARAAATAAPPTTDRIAAPPWPLLGVAALAGLSGLLLEVAWFRLMVLILGGSAYAFSIMLLAFLLGIGLGGWLAGGAADRAHERGGRAALLRRVALLQGGVAATSLAALYAYGQLPFAFVRLYGLVGPAPLPLWSAKLLLALAVMLVPATLMGAAFPLLVRAAAGSSRGVAAPVGRVYGANTIGAVAGAFGGGFLLLPLLHVQGTVIAAAAVSCLAGLLALATAGPARGATRTRARALATWSAAATAAIGLVCVVRPPWDPLIMTSGMYQYASGLAEPTGEELIRRARAPYELVSYDEGLSSVVTVGRARGTDRLFLANNGKVDASSHWDLDTQLLLAHLPFVFRPGPERVLVIGLASGITAGHVTLHEGPRRIDVVEIEPAVVRASHAFDAVNHRPLDDPRVRLVVNDARNHLLLAPDGAYDAVTSEPSNPWISGVSNLFTAEFFRLGRRKLAPGGVWIQWLHAYNMAPDDLRSLLATFADTYEHVRLFRVDDSDLILAGSDEPLPLRNGAIRDVLAGHPAIARGFAAAGILAPEHILARYAMSRDSILRLADDVERNTDDNMRIEHSAPLYLHVDTRAGNARLLAGAVEMPVPLTDGSIDLAALAAAYRGAGDTVRADIARAIADAPRVTATAE